MTVRNSSTTASILIVDDHPDELAFLSAALAKQGYEVFTASSETAALQAVHKHPPDLILLDITTPDRDGVQVCERLRADERTRDIPVLFIHASEGPVDTMRALDAGALDLIRKPFRTDEVLARVETRLTLRYLQKKLERRYEEILEQKEMLDGLLEHSPLAIVISDRERRITVVNPAFERLFGYSEEESLGRDVDDLLSTPQTVEKMRAISTTTVDEQQGLYTVGKRKRKDGTLIDVELITAPHYVRGKQYGSMVFYSDISDHLKAKADLEQSQEAYTSVLDTLEDPYYESDPEGILTYVNSAAGRVVGYKTEEVIGHHFGLFVDRTTYHELQGLVRSVFETKQPIRRYEGRYRRKDGEVRVAEWSVSPIFRGDVVVGSRGVIRDITPRVRAQEALRVAKDEAEARAEQLAAINRVSETVRHSLDLDAILQSASVELTKVFPVHSAGIALLNAEQTHLEVLGFHSLDPEEESAQGRMLSLQGSGESQDLIDAMTAAVFQDAQSDARAQPSHDSAQAGGTPSLLIVPLVSRGMAIGTIVMPARDPEYEFSGSEIELAQTIASQIATAVDNARLYAQTEKALDVAERDLEIGREIQSGFFPEHLPAMEGFEVQAHFQAARQVAGDFYDWFSIDGSDFVGLVIADVCDKGVGAALFMVLCRTLIRSISQQCRQFDRADQLLGQVVARLNNYITQTHGRSNMFATLFLGILDPATSALYYVNGGHEPPLVINVQGEITARLDPTGPAVGLMPDLPFEVKWLPFAGGDLLVAFTDGVPEAKDAAGAFYTEERLLVQCAQPWPSAFSVVKQVEADVFAHIGAVEQFDDVTLIAVRRREADQRNRHRFTVKAVLTNLPLLRDFAVEACQLMGVDEKVSASLKLAVEEACANVIQHGFKDTEPGDIRMSVEHLGDRVQVQIADSGAAFGEHFDAPPDRTAAVQDSELGGLGVFFVKAMVDELSYESSDGVNRLTLIKRL